MNRKIKRVSFEQIENAYNQNVRMVYYIGASKNRLLVLDANNEGSDTG